VLFHAGAVYRGLGDMEQAQSKLGAALAANPYFDADEADQARAWLAEGRASAPTP
jgi:hypothetical protein